ncbi:hypothetical protein EB796_019586 [Bugula neritina]|uniref:WW domain binding protein VOPP1 n=1 Tax=Bugula neritina TaxID=10212 RepID=A0A7J7J7S0_BUGNE|nr:hypothetical protein EB796_019586 [Bugula neritina]
MITFLACISLFLAATKASTFCYSDDYISYYCDDYERCCGYMSCCTNYSSVWGLWYFWLVLIIVLSIISSCIGCCVRAARRRQMERYMAVNRNPPTGYGTTVTVEQVATPYYTGTGGAAAPPPYVAKTTASAPPAYHQ